EAQRGKQREKPLALTLHGDPTTARVVETIYSPHHDKAFHSRLLNWLHLLFFPHRQTRGFYGVLANHARPNETPLCEIVALASKGKSTTITRRNKPVACVVPAERHPRRLPEQWRRRVVNVRLNRKGQPKLTISQLIQKGRK